MTELTSISQLSDKKNASIIFINKQLCSDRLVDELEDEKSVFLVDTTTKFGRNLQEAHGITYIPSAIFIRNGKPSNVYMGTRAILSNARKS